MMQNDSYKRVEIDVILNAADMIFNERKNIIINHIQKMCNQFIDVKQSTDAKSIIKTQKMFQQIINEKGSELEQLLKNYNRFTLIQEKYKIPKKMYYQILRKNQVSRIRNAKKAGWSDLIFSLNFEVIINELRKNPSKYFVKELGNDKNLKKKEYQENKFIIDNMQTKSEPFLDDYTNDIFDCFYQLEEENVDQVL